MDTVVQHIGGLCVESAWMDPDGLGARQWNLVRGLGAADRLCTTSELRSVLRELGLDIGDLALVVSTTPVAGSRARIAPAAVIQGQPERSDAEDDDDPTDDVDDECE